MTDYVAGFLFSNSGAWVALIEKERPEWQRGYLNGVGGKVEEGERPDEAMAREFKEETGVDTNPSDWECFLILRGEWGSVCFFRHFSLKKLLKVSSLTDERVAIYSMQTTSKTLPNLRWILPLAAYTHDHYKTITVEDQN